MTLLIIIVVTQFLQRLTTTSYCHLDDLISLNGFINSYTSTFLLGLLCQNTLSIFNSSMLKGRHFTTSSPLIRRYVRQRTENNDKRTIKSTLFCGWEVLVWICTNNNYMFIFLWNFVWIKQRFIGILYSKYCLQIYLSNLTK